MVHPIVRFKLWFHGYRSHRRTIDGVKVHYYIKRGSDNLPPLVLIHGIAANADHYEPVLPQLARAENSIFVIDLPGHGESSELDREMTAENLFKTFEKILDTLVPEKFILMGNSLGGALSLRYSSERPERVAGLVLLSPATGFNTEEEWLQLHGLLKMKTREEYDRFLNTIFPVKLPFYLPVMRLFFRRALERKGVQELLAKVSFADIQPAPDLKIYSGKTLLIWGKNEILFPRNNLKWLREQLGPHTICEEPELVGHCVHIDNPRWFTARVIDFIQKI